MHFFFLNYFFTELRDEHKANYYFAFFLNYASLTVKLCREFCTGEDIPSENIYLESNDLQSPLGADYVLSYRTYLSEAQKKRVMMLIQEIQPDFTVYVATMRKTTVQPPGPYLVRHFSQDQLFC